MNTTARPSFTGAMLGVSAMVAAAVGVVSVTIAVAGDDDGDVATGSTGGAPTQALEVELTEFAINPADVSAPAGSTIHVTNAGAIEHNLAVVDEGVWIENLGGGEEAELALGDLAPGEYEWICEVAGHADAGMKGTLTVTEGGAVSGGETASGGEATADDAGSHDEMDYQAMTDAMMASFSEYPAETAGRGNELLEPTEILADGTKVFDLTMEYAQWEVSPGEFVEAATYNGIVPGPMIQLELGERMQLRVTNELPMATDVHMHGLNVENQFDGVSPLTQDIIEPGDTFTYEYVADEPAVAMYHPHAHGHELLPDGMFGVILVGDVRLPVGQTVGLEEIPADLQISQEIPMVLNDAGVIGYSLNGKSFPATEPYTGTVGDWVLIHYYNEGTQIHPMHLHQFDQIVVAKDGYPLDNPYTADTVLVSPGERYSVLVNLDKPGAWVWHCHILSHAERSDSSMYGMVTALIVE